MRLLVNIEGSVRQQLDGELVIGERAVTQVVRSLTYAIRDDWRNQVRGSGLGGRLANTIGGVVYPGGQNSLNAAGLIWSKAPKIVGAHDRGDLIRSQSGFWLAIPLPSAGKSGRGGRITPGEWERKTGRRLKFIYRPGRSALLVDDGTVLRGARVMTKKGHSRAARGFRNRTVPIFALAPQVKLQKRLNLYAVADGVAARAAAGIVAQWR